MSNLNIDIVILWVDGGDSDWQADYLRYRPDAKFDAKRYRDWGLLPFWFRGIEKFAPWVNKIFFVTCGQVPKWLNLEAPKLVHIKHEDYIPKEYLPTFNSSAIELFINRIPGLSEHFVFFNDDIYLVSPVTSKRFFQKELPCDMPIEGGYEALHNGFNQIFYNDIAYINQSFRKRKVIKKMFGKWFNIKYGNHLINNIVFQMFPYFVNFKPLHLAQPYLKSTYNEVWDAYGQELADRTMTRFRGDRNINQYLQRAWQLCSGKFYPYNPLHESKCIALNDNNIQEIASLIVNQKYSMLCLNDSPFVEDFEKDKRILQEAFQQILPNKSIYEI